MEYDSTAETLKHIKRVNELLLLAAKEIAEKDARIKELEQAIIDAENDNCISHNTIAAQSAYIAELKSALEYEHEKCNDLRWASHADDLESNDRCHICRLLAKPAP